jgi:hypothetical protein
LPEQLTAAFLDEAGGSQLADEHADRAAGKTGACPEL